MPESTVSERLAQLLTAWQEARRLGRTLAAEDLCEGTPELLDALRLRIEAVEAAERAGATLTFDVSPGTQVTKVAAIEADAHRTTIAERIAEPALRQAPPGYEFLAELGRGGMGVVLKARDLKLNRIVAIKMVLAGGLASPASLVRFLAEAEALAALQHPNVVHVYERGQHQGLPYFVMEYCSGGSLGAKVRENPLSARAAAELVEQLARGVAAAHASNILHRDLKPENVLFSDDGTPKIADFGLAKRFDSSDDPASPLRERGELTATGAILGTPSYMAPEQARGEIKSIGPATDVYALGALLYRILTGRPPFLGANPADTVRQVIDDEPLSPSELTPSLPRDLVTICLKCLHKEPGRRYSAARELAADLRRFLDGRPIEARPVGRFERAVKWVKRNPVITGSALAVMLALAIGGGIAYAKYLDAEKAREEEAERVRERDKAIASERLRVIERDKVIGERDNAIGDLDDEKARLTYQLGVSSMMLAANAYDNWDVKLAAERLDEVPVRQRKFEWHYLKRQVRGGLFTLYGHTGPVMGVSFSPDGSRIVAGSQDQTAKVWDAKTGRPLVDLKGHTGTVSSASFSPDGSRIVTGSSDRTAKVWDAKAGTPLVDLKGHTGEVTSVAFSSDGTRIVTGSWDQTAKVWDANMGTPLVDLKGHTGAVESVSFSPDGSRIVTGSSDRTVRVWDAKAGTPLVDLKGHTGEVTSVAFSSDGTRIVTGSWDQTAKVWDANMGTPLVDLKGHTGAVESVSFSPDGSRIVTGSGDFGKPGEAKVWDAKTGTPLVDLKGHTSDVRSVGFSPDGSRIVTGSSDRTAKVWDAKTGTPLVDLKGHTYFVNCVSFSPDGSRIVTGGSDRTAKVWDAKTGTPLVDLKGHRGIVTSVSFSPDGSRIVTGSDDRTAKVWDAKTGTPLVDLKGHADRVKSVSFSPDGLRIVTGSPDRTAKVWDAKTGTPLVDLKGRTSGVYGVSYSPDGTRIVTGSSDQTAKVWDAKTGTPLVDLKGHTSDVWSVGFSPDGTRIVTGSSDRTAKVWDVQTGTPLMDLKGHTRYVESVSYSPDGTRIVTGSSDQTAKVWDAKTGTPLVDLKGHRGIVTSVSFSPDGSRIVTGSSDGTAKVWDYRGGDELWKDGLWNAEEFSYRLHHTRPSLRRYRESYQTAQQAKDPLAMQFYLDRALSVVPNTEDLRLRNQIHPDPRLIARAGFHHPEFAKTPYNRTILHSLAVNGDRLAKRLVAQELLRDAKPQAAVPLLFECMLSRPTSKPPVEELLLAQSYLDLKQPDEARRFYRAATDWLERYEQPIQVINLVSHHALNPWAGLGEVFAPIDDPRRNPFDWESWLECDVFRARVERQLR